MSVHHDEQWQCCREGFGAFKGCQAHLSKGSAAAFMAAAAGLVAPPV